MKLELDIHEEDGKIVISGDGIKFLIDLIKFKESKEEPIITNEELKELLKEIEK